MCSICIPGSHDSGAYWFNLRMGYAHDQSFLRYVRNFRCNFVKRIVERWGLTQSLPIDEQLQIGVRFFDIRLELALDINASARQNLAQDPDDSSRKSCFIVHGLYSIDCLKLAHQMVDFLVAHKEEVLILNVSHIYRMTEYDFRRFFLHPFSSIAERCGISLCPTDVDLRIVTLDELIEKEFRIIVVGPSDQDMDGCCFRSAALQNKWPRKNNTSDLLVYLQAQIHAPVTPGLRVLQGVITPELSDIFRNLRSSLKKTFSLPMRGLLKEWLQRLDDEEIGNLNILISDQVDTEFCRLVYYLNINEYPEHKLDSYSVNPYLENKPRALKTKNWDAEITYPTPPESDKKERSVLNEPLEDGENEPEFLIEEIFDEFEVPVSSIPPKKPIRTSVMVQQVEMVLDESTSSEDTSLILPRSPIPPPKPKRFSQRIPLVMEVQQIPDDDFPYSDAPCVPFSRSSDTPVRIALPVTEEELRLAALGEYPRYGSQRSQRSQLSPRIEEKKDDNLNGVEEKDGSDDDEAPLISHEVESMVEDLIINSTIDAMDNLADRFKSHE